MLNMRVTSDAMRPGNEGPLLLDGLVINLILTYTGSVQGWKDSSLVFIHQIDLLLELAKLKRPLQTE